MYEIDPVYTAKPEDRTVFTIKFNYKKPNESVSRNLSLNVLDDYRSFANSSNSMRFAGSLAAYAMELRQSPYRGNASRDQIRSWASGALDFDPNGYRARHMQLLAK